MNSEEIEFMEDLIIRELKGFKNKILTNPEVQDSLYLKNDIETKFNEHLEEMGYEEVTK
jgi:phenylalanyl-tRNA synthetase beta subunit